MSRNPWRYRCPECGSTALSRRVEAGGYRCERCQHTCRLGASGCEERHLATPRSAVHLVPVHAGGPRTSGTGGSPKVGGRSTMERNDTADVGSSMDTETQDDVEALDFVRLHDDETATLELEVTRPFIEWIDLEATADGVSIHAWAVDTLRETLTDGLTPGGGGAVLPPEPPAGVNDDPDVETGPEPPESVRWHDDDRGTLVLRVSRALAEDLATKPDSHNWALMSLQLPLRQILEREHGPKLDIEVDVSEEFAQRIGLWMKHSDIEGNSANIRDHVLENTTVNYTWTLNGEPWLLVEEADR